jgi:hypothetical protein
MSFRDFIETFQSQALSDKLAPSDQASWNYICREYSKIFHTPLHEVFKLSPEFVCLHIFAEQLSNVDIEENLELLQDKLSALLDPEFDIKRERAYREELKQIQEQENLRLAEGRAVHPSLDKKTKKEPPKEELPSDLPKQGGLSAALIKQLQDKEG